MFQCMYKTLLYDLTVHVGPVSPLYFKNVDDITTFKSFALRTIFITSYIINLLIQRFRSVRWLFYASLSSLQLMILISSSNVLHGPFVTFDYVCDIQYYFNIASSDDIKYFYLIV